MLKIGEFSKLSRVSVRMLRPGAVLFCQAGRTGDLIKGHSI